jgi:integrase
MSVVQQQEKKVDTSFNMFIESLNGSAETRKNYTKWLSRYMQHCNLEFSCYHLREIIQEEETEKEVTNYYLTNTDTLFFDSSPKTIENKIISFFMHKRNAEKKSPKTLQLYYTTIKHFYEINDITLNWAKIKQFVTKGRMKKANDRAYTRQEIRQILQKCDERKKVIVLLLASTGIRVGALPSLRKGHLEYLDKHKIYKINVYADSKNETDKYVTYCTKECTEAINGYLLYRERSGEVLQDSSPLIRNQFDPYTKDRKTIEKPCNISLNTIVSIIHRTITDTGIRDDKQIKKLGDRHSVMQLHGFRKFTKTQMTFAGVDHVYSETILGHIRRGLVGTYNTVTDEDLLENYLKAEAKLTIGSTEEEHLRKQVEFKEDQINYVTKGMQEKYEKQNFELRQEIKQLQQKIEEKEEKAKQDKEIVQRYNKLEEQIEELRQKVMSSSSSRK